MEPEEFLEVVKETIKRHEHDPELDFLCVALRAFVMEYEGSNLDTPGLLFALISTFADRWAK